jgi:DNA processing protein
MIACDDCLRRADLVAAISGRLEIEFKRRSAPPRVLALPDEELLELGAGEEARRRYASFDPAQARGRAEAVGLTTVCRCREAYPAALRDLPDPPAVVHILGDPGVLGAGAASRSDDDEHGDGVALVGARRASSYGLEVARSLGRGLSAAGVTVVSGLALGVDSAAHAGALEASGRTVGVLAGSAHVAYPARGWRLHRAVAERGAVISELPPGAHARRWCFVARNRIIAALAAATVVVQAAERSGSLTTADFAAELGRAVGAVPGQVTSRLSAGTHGLIVAGAPLIRDTADALDLLAGATGREYHAAAQELPALSPELRRLLDAVEDGGALAALTETPQQARAALAGLGELERRGLVRRGLDGRWERTA